MPYDGSEHDTAVTVAVPPLLDGVLPCQSKATPPSSHQHFLYNRLSHNIWSL